MATDVSTVGRNNKKSVNLFKRQHPSSSILRGTPRIGGGGNGRMQVRFALEKCTHRTTVSIWRGDESFFKIGWEFSGRGEDMNRDAQGVPFNQDYH